MLYLDCLLLDGPVVINNAGANDSEGWQCSYWWLLLMYRPSCSDRIRWSTRQPPASTQSDKQWLYSHETKTSGEYERSQDVSTWLWCVWIIKRSDQPVIAIFIIVVNVQSLRCKIDSVNTFSVSYASFYRWRVIVCRPRQAMRLIVALQVQMRIEKAAVMVNKRIAHCHRSQNSSIFP